MFAFGKHFCWSAKFGCWFRSYAWFQCRCHSLVFLLLCASDQLQLLSVPVQSPVYTLNSSSDLDSWMLSSFDIISSQGKGYPCGWEVQKLASWGFCRGEEGKRWCPRGGKHISSSWLTRRKEEAILRMEEKNSFCISCPGSQLEWEEVSLFNCFISALGDFCNFSRWCPHPLQCWPLMMRRRRRMFGVKLSYAANVERCPCLKGNLQVFFICIAVSDSPS